MLCLDNEDLLSQLNRLTGSSLGIDRCTEIDRMIDLVAISG
jgi:hypothetical protein